MNKIFEKVDWCIPLLINALYFITAVVGFPQAVYFIAASIAAVYYLPFRFFTNKQVPNRLIYFISCFICSLILSVSLLYLINRSPYFKMSIIYIGFANLIFMLLSFGIKNNRVAETHFCFNLLASSVAFVGD